MWRYFAMTEQYEDCISSGYHVWRVNMDKNMKSYYYRLLIVLCVVSVLPFLLICKYVHPVNDDYVYALRDGSMNPLQSVWSTYLDWSGRYFATFLSSANPLINRYSCGFCEKIYSVVIILLFVGSIYIFVRSLFHKYMSNVQQIALSAFLIVLFLVQAPRISEFFYWFSSYVAYTVPCMLTMLLFSIIHRRNVWFIGLQALLVMCIIGSNEVVAVLLAGTLFYWASENYRQSRTQVITLVVVTVFAMLIVVSSPGNFHRMSGQLSSHPYLWSFVVSLFQSVTWFFIWLPTLLLATVLFIPLFGTKIARMSIFDRSLKKYLSFVLLTIFLAHIPPTLGLSSVMIGRTADDLYLFFIFFYFFGILILLGRYARNVSEWYNHNMSRIFASCMFFVFVFLCVFQIDTPIATAYIDILSGKAANYDCVIEQRYSIIRNSQGAQTHDVRQAALCLPSLALVPKTIYVNDLNNDTLDVFNLAYKDYYGLNKGVVVRNSQHLYLSNYESLFLIGKSLRH
jgi:hypothetical protein